MVLFLVGSMVYASISQKKSPLKLPFMVLSSIAVIVNFSGLVTEETMDLCSSGLFPAMYRFCGPAASA